MTDADCAVEGVQLIQAAMAAERAGDPTEMGRVRNILRGLRKPPGSAPKAEA